jgi:PAS domain S-box-containing protein
MTGSKRSRWLLRLGLAVGEGLILWAIWMGVGAQTQAVNQAVLDISELKDPSPFRAALLGHLGKIHLGLRSYLRDPDPALERQAADGRRDFIASLPEFARQNPRLFPKEAREEIQRTFDQFKDLADRALKLNADRLAGRRTLEKNFSDILSLIDKNVRPLIRKEQPDGEERSESILNIENQLRAWQANLTQAWTPSSASGSALSIALENDNRGATYLELYGRMQLLPRERKMQRSIQALWQANSDLARKSFIMENIVGQAEKAMDAEREQIVSTLNHYLPAMPPSQLESRKDTYLRRIRLHLAAASLLGILALVTLSLAVIGGYRLTRARPTVADGMYRAPKAAWQEPTLEMDMKGVITAWSGGAEALYGYTAAETLGQSIGLLFESESEISRLDHELHAAKRTTFGTTHKTKSGVPVNIQMEFRPVPDHLGHPKAISLVCTRLVPG